MEESYKMKNKLKNLKAKLKSVITKMAARITASAHAAVDMLYSKTAIAKRAIAGNSGEGYVDTAVKILICVVIGALVLAALYTLFGDTVMPAVTQRVRDMFNYNG